MGEKKVTIMVLKVDLQCEKCYKKVKKVLCKIPQIRDEVYDEKNNQVIIKVVCCSPEKIRDKICCKGGGAIKSIDIKEPEKSKPPTEKSKPPQKEEEKSKPPQKEEEKPNGTTKEPEKHKEPEKLPEKTATTSVPTRIPDYPPVTMGTCCMECYGGHGGGPCQTGYGYGGGYGRGAAPYIQYDGYYGRPVYDSYRGCRSYATSSYCVSEENPQACAIM